MNKAFKDEPKVVDDSLQKSLLSSLNGSFKDSDAPVEAVDDQLQDLLVPSLNVAFKDDDPKVQAIDELLRDSLKISLNGSFKEKSEEKVDNSLQDSLLISLNGAFKDEPKIVNEENKEEKEEEENKEEDVQYTDENFIKLIIKNPTTDKDAETIIKMIIKINSQEPQEIDEIGNTHFHYIAGSFYEHEQKEAMFEEFAIDFEKIRPFFNYQNAEGTTPLMILFLKCENIEDLQKINEAEYVNFAEDIEQEDIYGNSIFSILTKKMVEFSRKEIQIQNTLPNFIQNIIQNKITRKDIPNTIDSIDPLENTALHYVAGSFLSTENKIEIMKDQLANMNYQNIEGTTPLMILTKHMTKEDLEKEDVKDFIAENIADLEQEDIYGNSVFSILTKKIVEFSGEEKVEFQ